MPDPNNPPLDAKQPEQDPPIVNFVQDSDLRLLAIIAAGALITMILFGTWLHFSKMLEFASFETRMALNNERGYLSEALFHRERRFSLSLLYRTFLTGFSFVVGLAICTMGGVFILRQVRVQTILAGNVAPGGSPEPVSFWATIKTSSPGIVFLLAGLTLMLITQMFAIPINTPEIMPRHVAQLMQYDAEQGEWREVTQLSNVTGVAVPRAGSLTSSVALSTEAFCALPDTSPDDLECATQ